ncbi:hypothetical protein [Kingella oralis]|uniref:Uncharacterized protein n=1 Tax=Kingella oralis ATCC 51147 TaxID=629741 RepID=C4GMX9_9NEIS|nr:hypothetical protein [Kingella oralis]EEP66664.1 hypothetical protein GCWU000324_03067 [Kingella oralis ATCC 51147]QMT42459.1 hypothetical protein H3L93_10830 [Kingella oralis]
MNVLKHHIQNEDRELEWALNYNAPNAGTPAWFLYPITLFKTAVRLPNAAFALAVVLSLSLFTWQPWISLILTAAFGGLWYVSYQDELGTSVSLNLYDNECYIENGRDAQTIELKGCKFIVNSVGKGAELVLKNRDGEQTILRLCDADEGEVNILKRLAKYIEHCIATPAEYPTESSGNTIILNEPSFQPNKQPENPAADPFNEPVFGNAAGNGSNDNAPVADPFAYGRQSTTPADDEPLEFK